MDSKSRSGPASKRSFFPTSARDVGIALVVAAVYVGAAKVGLSLSVAHGNATPVWAPTGIAIAALILFGSRLWPGVLLGAFLANATTPVPLWASGLIACGNTLEAIVGSLLMRRFGFRPWMDRGRDVLALVGFGGVVAPVVSATVGVSALSLADAFIEGGFAVHWGVWWVGDAMGALLVAPLLLTWLSTRRPTLSPRSLAEAFVILAGLVFVGGFVFSQEPPAASFLVFPLIVWATLRFGQRGATASVIVATVFGITAILSGSRPFGGVTETESVALLQALMSLVAISCLVITATISEREKAYAALHSEAERSATRQAQLAEAQRLAHLGSWEWTLSDGRVTWSDEMYRIHGYQPQEFEIGFDWVLSRVVADDRAAIQENVESALSGGSLPPIEYRIERPDGEQRLVRGEGEIFLDADGSPAKMIGTVMDVTEQRRAEEIESRLREVELNHQQALELNDEVVQGLATAKLALELGQVDEARAALDATLESARGIVTDLMSKNGESKPGGFRRSAAARSKS